MLEYIEKFNNLPSDVKQKVSSGEVMAAIDGLEKKYGAPLAAFVIRVMVGDLYFKNIAADLIIEFSLAPEQAAALEKELNEKVFAKVVDYLAGSKSSRAKEAPEEEESPFFVKKSSLARAPLIAVPADAKAMAGKPAGVPLSGIKNFLQEDEKDIAAMGKMAGAFGASAGGNMEIMLGEIVREANISFPSADLTKRFKDVLSTYLRGVRAKVEVRENLLKEVASGGIKLSVADADRVLDIAQKKLAAREFSAAGPGKVSARAYVDGTSFVFNEAEIKQALAARKSGIAGSRDVEYDLAALREKSSFAKASPSAPQDGASGDKPEDKSTFVRPGRTATDKPAPVSLTESSAVNLPKEPEKNITATAPAIIAPAIKMEKNEPKRTAAIIGNKKRMEDVKSAPKIMSPIDELAYLDLVNFRRLDPSPAKRAAKIEEKIALLEKEGIDKKIAGIRAWRNNPVGKTYLAMGQESIDGGKSIDDIIKERQSQGLNYLSREEFDAVMDLNDSLRF